MKHLKLAKKNKRNRLPLLVGMLLIVVASLVTTNLVQKTQDTRSSAAEKCSCSKKAYGNAASCSKNKGKWTCITTSVKKSTPTPVKKSTPTGCKLNSKYYNNGQTTCSGSQVALCVDGGKQGFYWKYSNCPNGCDSKTGKCITTDKLPLKSCILDGYGIIEEQQYVCMQKVNLYTCVGGTRIYKYCKNGCTSGHRECN